MASHLGLHCLPMSHKRTLHVGLCGLSVKGMDTVTIINYMQILFFILKYGKTMQYEGYSNMNATK